MTAVPWWPLALSLGGLGVVLWSARQPVWAMAAVLALLPVAHLGVWSGWRQVDEFELLLTLVLLGATLHRWRAPRPAHPAGARGPAWWVYAMAALWCLSVGLAWWRADAGWPAWWEVFWGDEHSAAAPWRAARSTVWAVWACWCLWPWRAEREATRRLSWGMVTGLGCLCVAVFCERLQAVAWWDLASDYRTTGWFWEMNLGGGAIDAYLAMALPFAWWALTRARRPLGFAVGAVLLMASWYVVVTTYSRGILVVAAVLSAHAVWWQSRQSPSSRPAWWRPAWRGLCLLWLVEVVLLVSMSQLAGQRLAQSLDDTVGRWRHWQAITGLMTGPSDLWRGLGLGQVPVQYSQRHGHAELPGRTTWQPQGDHGPAHLALSGPATRLELAGRWAIMQRIQLPEALAAHHVRVRLHGRVEHPLQVSVAVCQQHLLYPIDCAQMQASWQPGDAMITLDGPGFRGASPAVLKVSVSSVAGQLRLQQVQLWADGQAVALQNANFSRGSAHWWPVSQSYFIPWHVDNLYLEVLVERGLPALLALAVLIVHGGWRAGRVPDGWPWAGAVLSIGLLGSLISVFEFTRVAFLLQFLLWWTSFSGDESRRLRA